MTPEEIQRNYIESFQFLDERKRRQVSQLVLLNNLNRGDQNIASTLLITLLNRTMAALYDDRLQVKFLPSQGINQDQINAYNILAQSDYMEMGKAKADYDWVWDTLFFGRGYCETYSFDKKKKLLTPETLNPLAFGYDPFVEAVQGWRYYWKWTTMDKWTINRLIKAGKITGITDAKDLPSGIEPRLWEYKQRRDAATKAVEPSLEPAQPDIYQILVYYGHDEKGKRCRFLVDKHFSKVLSKEELDFQDLELEDGTMGSRWPIVVKESFRVPHSSVSFSVADLLEDKHRAKSVLLNLAYIAAKDAANPLYWYDPSKVKDVSQFFSRQINQHIPVEGDGSLAVGPLNVKDPMPAGLISFITMLQQEANDPIGTGVSVEPNAGGQETATEVAIDQQLNDMAQSLASKVLQFGESEFWSHWWHRYARNADALGTKMANIVGVNGVESTEIDFGDFKTNYPPGVLVFSAKEAEYKNLVKRRDWMQILPSLMQSMDPNGFRNFQKHVFMPLMVEDPSLIDVMFPNSIEELKAQEQNEMLKNGDMPPVLDTDDHQTHIYIHRMMTEKTWASWLHIMEHEEALAKQQAQATMEATQGEESGGTKPQFGSERKSPMGAAAPLKQEAKTNMSSNNKNQ